MSVTYSELDNIWLRPTLLVFSSTEPIQDPNNKNKWRWIEGTEKLYLTDDNRDPLQVSPERIGTKKRMIDGTMRSVHVADKTTFSTSWQNIPSRSKDSSREYISEYERSTDFTSGFGAGIDIKNWYEKYTDDFWVLMVYDTDTTVAAANNAEKIHVFFDTFDYTVSKRGQFLDLWNVNIGLVEV
jgi:hypothetical protein